LDFFEDGLVYVGAENYNWLALLYLLIVLCYLGMAIL
jgi:hypothetical protein